MSGRKITFSVGEFYHVYNRGIDKRVIFNDSRDYNRFQALLYVCNGSNEFSMRDHFKNDLEFHDLYDFNRGEKLVSIGAYTIMPNHFHILIYENREKGISIFMHKLLTAYSSYFNARNKRKGHVYEGTFKANHIDNDEYLKYVFSYIHVNHIKILKPNWYLEKMDSVELEKLLSSYDYSSYKDWIGERSSVESKILTKEDFPKYFETVSEMKEYIYECAQFKSELEYQKKY